MIEIHPGDTVKVEHTFGRSTPNPVVRVVEGIAYRDDEGTLRVENVNLERDENGRFARSVILLSVTR